MAEQRDGSPEADLLGKKGEASGQRGVTGRVLGRMWIRRTQDDTVVVCAGPLSQPARRIVYTMWRVRAMLHVLLS
jgi:hypothetical protein